jgi:hypothetical protein
VPSALSWAPVTSAPVELLEDEGVEDVGARVELGHELPKLGVHGRLHRARDLDGGREDVPDLPARRFHADDLHFSPAPAQHASVGELTSSAGVERRFPEQHRTGTRIDDKRRDGQHLWMLVTEVARHSGLEVRASTRTCKCSPRASRRVKNACASGSTTAAVAFDIGGLDTLGDNRTSHDFKLRLPAPSAGPRAATAGGGETIWLASRSS